MSVVLVNGDGNPAVHASQDADLLGGIGGQETGILDINDKFAATIADANTVEISSGVCITKEGRRIQIDVGDVEEIVVPTGSQGTTKYYIIGFHLYTDGSGNQLAETFIDEVASPSATITEKMFKDGETEVYVSLYRITRNGLNLEGLTLILPEIGSLAGGGIIGNTDISGIADGTVTGAIAQINTDLSDQMVPDYNNAEDLNLSATGTNTFTATKNGFICVQGYGSVNAFIAFHFGDDGQGNYKVNMMWQSADGRPRITGFAPIGEGDTANIQTSQLVNDVKGYFIPSK